MSKRGLFYSIIVFAAISAFSQEVLDAPRDTIEQTNDKQPATLSRQLSIGLFAEATKMKSPTPGGFQNSFWAAAGTTYRKWQAGIFVSIYKDSNYTKVVFPNTYALDYLYGGGWLEYTLLNSKWALMNASIAYGKGDVIWTTSSITDQYFRDTHSTYHIGLTIESPRIRFIRPIIKIGYRSMSEIDMPAIQSDDFSGLTASVGLKLGYYPKQERNEK